MDAYNPEEVAVRTKAMVMLEMLMERAIDNAAAYMRAAQRTVLTARDVQLGMMCECHEFMERETLEDDFAAKVQETFGEDDSSGEESECGSQDGVDEAVEPFTPAPDSAGSLIKKMNEYAATWDTWEPSDPVQRRLKEAIDSQCGLGA